MSMHERSTYPAVISPEEQADFALQEGNTQLARSILYEAIAKTYSHDPETAHHLALKAITLPFHELIHQPPTEELFHEASLVYGWVGELLEHEIENFINQPLPAYRSYGIGNITELIILGMFSRDIAPSTLRVPIPAYKRDDTASREPIDFYLTPIHGKMATPHFIQVKTLVTTEHIAHYQHSSVGLVGLNQLDAFYGTPFAHDSLAQTILRDAKGDADRTDKARLHVAIDLLHALGGISLQESHSF